MYINLKNSVLIIIVALAVNFIALNGICTASISFTGASGAGKDASDLHVGRTFTSPHPSTIPHGSGGGVIEGGGSSGFRVSSGDTISKNPLYDPQGAGFLLLILSLVSFALAWFILVEAFRFQQETFKKSGWNVAADSGLTLSALFSIFVFAAWFFRWFSSLINYNTGSDVLMSFIYYLLYNPIDFAPAFFVASIVPSTIGAYKFLFALSMLNQIDGVVEKQKPNEDMKKQKRSPFTAWIGAGFAIIQLIASVVTLILFFGNNLYPKT